MTFAPGDAVHVAALGTGVVREVRNGGRYLVEIKGRAVVVAGDQLSPAGPRRPRRASPRAFEAGQPVLPAISPPSLDLHGRTVPDALDALDTFLNDALLAGHAELRVVHGRSGGRIKAAVHARLKQMPAIRAFRLDPRNPGVTIVAL